MDNTVIWHKFYFHRWEANEDVKLMDAETLGVFLTLLIYQMGQGDLPEDVSSLAGNIGHKISAELLQRVWEEKGLKKLFVPVTEKWVFSEAGTDIDDGDWVPCEPKPGRIHNKFCTKVILDDERKKKNKRNGGLKAQETKANKSLEAALSERQAAAPTFDFSEILKTMPKRKAKGQWEGWDQGKEQLKFVTTQEEFDDLLAATRAYAKQRRGEDPAYHISFYNWVTKEHHKYVPAKSIANPEPASTPAATPSKPEAPKYPPEWCYPEDATFKLSYGEKPPWIPGRYDSPAEKDYAARKFPDDDTKHRWWRGEDIPEPPKEVKLESVK